ncbi:60S ribosomal protein L32-like, partial [Phyllostomus discolor]|uniref:60S ribosomal protein L32 n=1 Tax=Phyllostomus discolor TaxID=89673 RepID=A0A7E6CZX3_9CHIR
SELVNHLLLSTIAALRSLMKPKIVKKRMEQLTGHQSDQYVKIKHNWWKPRGNRVRRRFKGQLLMPSIGYESNQKTKHMLPSSFWKSLINDATALETLLMYNNSYYAETVHSVSSRTCKATVERAAQLASRLTGPNARLHREEKEQRAYVHTVLALIKP